MLLAVLLLSLFAAEKQPTPQSSVLVTKYRGSDDVRLWGQGTPDGKMFEYAVTKAEFARLPEWDPEKALPPLPISGLIDIARKATRTAHPEFSDVMPWSIQLNQVGGAEKRQSRWFYVVNLYPLMNGELSIDSMVTVVVLMNGTVVKPQTREAPSR